MTTEATAPAAAPVQAPVSAPAPAAAPVAAATAAPAAQAPVAAALFTAAPAQAPADPTAAPGQAVAADVPEWLPVKYRVVGQDGKLDMAASSQKLAEGYSNAEKRIGSGDIRPDDPSKYTFALPEALKDVPLDQGLTDAFRKEAHESGLTQKQYELVMGKYFELVPKMLDGAAKVSAEQARESLRQVWPDQAAYEANLSAGQKAIHGLPHELQSKVVAALGTNPEFAQVMAHFGKQMREDTPPMGGKAPSGFDAGIAMASEAYRNPKHPEHARVSEAVRQHHERIFGSMQA